MNCFKAALSAVNSDKMEAQMTEPLGSLNSVTVATIVHPSSLNTGQYYHSLLSQLPAGTTHEKNTHTHTHKPTDDNLDLLLGVENHTLPGIH